MSESTKASLSAGRTIILIPARLRSTRLPEKPLAMIGDDPMIVHCLKQAQAANLGPVLVAAAEPDIIKVVEEAGGYACLTRPGHPSGSDRIAEALNQFDPEGHYDYVINMQGDLPLLDPDLLRKLHRLLAANDWADIATLAAPAAEAEYDNPNVVKVIAAVSQIGDKAAALAFTRARAPYGDGPLFHHIGLYGFRRSALHRFVGLPPGMLEQREKLEQLRALENQMKIIVEIVADCPVGVDTKEDLAAVRRQYAQTLGS